MSDSPIEKLWECDYVVIGWNNEKFHVTDWIYSTSQPSADSIGHYWKSLFNYSIEKESCYEIPFNSKDTNTAIIGEPYYD